ncbi:PaaI family thioesterase [Actibacterium lipolyticum]|uniref:Thioesterase domain-containing protein n=1 Tax=Actibacterium lipolyticum TaxID=1524263 RepID=A0A238KNM2_9RHOB|nr:PaaI family thioesterase [Actibacterium lipolyticum]SMX44237.1 hypothetical protein COL8621_02506 [Actibacterium lipolyticum]
MTDTAAPLLEEPNPFMRHVGAEMVDWGPDFVRFELPLAPFLMNRYEIPHGGVYASLLDTAMGYSGCYTGDADNKKLGMTLSMNVQFLSQPKGTKLIAEGRRTGGGKRTFFSEATITDETGEIIATGTGVFRYRG